MSRALYFRVTDYIIDLVSKTWHDKTLDITVIKRNGEGRRKELFNLLKSLCAIDPRFFVSVRHYVFRRSRLKDFKIHNAKCRRWLKWESLVRSKKSLYRGTIFSQCAIKRSTWSKTTKQLLKKVHLIIIENYSNVCLFVCISRELPQTRSKLCRNSGEDRQTAEERGEGLTRDY